MKNSILFILIFSISCTKVFSQSIKKSGEVSGNISNEDLEPIIYANISLLNPKDLKLIKGSITDENGNFKLENLAFGNYLLEISYLGYEKLYTETFVINENQTLLNKKLLLKKASTDLDAVIITTQTPFIERRIDKTILNVENSVLSAGNTALEILQRAPGVIVDNFGNISLGGKQNVLIMMNGKPTNLSADQLLTLLRSTDGNSIGTLELISNPSSKYDAAGSSGIINIKMKKNRNYGTNGSVTGGAGYGEDYKTNASLSLNHRNRNFNVHGSYNFSYNKTLTQLDLLRDNSLNNEITYFDQKGESRSNDTNNSYKSGIDFFINDNNTLGFEVDGQSNTSKINSFNETFIGSQIGIVDSTVVADNPFRGKFSKLAYNLNYRNIIDTLGQELNVDIDYAKYRNRNENNYNNFLFGAIENEKDIFRSQSSASINIWSAKIDYNYAFSESLKLESGFKSSFVNTDNDFLFENLVNEIFVNNKTLSNKFDYNENINATYLNLKKEFKTFSIQGGVRLEQTNSEGNSITEQAIVKRDYLDLFPSLAARVVLTKNNTLGLSYGRRIDRPDYAVLNPFTQFVDLFTFEQGNPFLNPQYTNSFELSWTYKDTYNISLAYSKTKDVISDAFLSNLEEKTLFITTLNLAEQTNYNLSINAPFSITKFWDTDNNFSLFQNNFQSPNIMGFPFRSSLLTYQFSSYNSIKINTTVNAELSGYYVSSQVVDTYLIKPITAIDFGINKSFDNGKGNIKFSVSDVFNTNIISVTSEIPTQNYNLDQKQETRIFRLSITYELGSSDVKGPRSRSKGSSDEENRVGQN